MRTTVDLPSAPHARVRRIAEDRGASLSTVLADLTARGLAALDEPGRLTRSPISGVLQVDAGRTVTAAQVADLLDE